MFGNGINHPSVAFSISPCTQHESTRILLYACFRLQYIRRYTYLSVYECYNGLLAMVLELRLVRLIVREKLVALTLESIKVLRRITGTTGIRNTQY